MILAEIARTGRLAPEFLKGSFALSVQELDERAAPLLGRAGPWTERLRIDSHEAAQAALLTLGNWLDFETYTADRGKAYRDQKLGEIATLRELPRFTTDKIMESVRKIDVIWVREEDFPECFFEVEHTTEITMGLHRMFQARGFNAKFFIVAPPDARPRFDREIGKAPFKSAREKYRFRSYPELESVFQKGKAYFEVYRSFFA